MDETGVQRFSESWAATRKRGGNPMLDEGMELANVPRPAGFAEARRLAFDACCSVYSVPPALVASADSDRNADSAARSFGTDAVQPVGDLLALAFTRTAVPAFYADNPAAHRMAVVCDVSDLTRDRFAQRMEAAGRPWATARSLPSSRWTRCAAWRATAQRERYKRTQLRERLAADPSALSEGCLRDAVGRAAEGAVQTRRADPRP